MKTVINIIAYLGDVEDEVGMVYSTPQGEYGYVKTDDARVLGALKNSNIFYSNTACDMPLEQMCRGYIKHLERRDELEQAAIEGE